MWTSFRRQSYNTGTFQIDTKLSPAMCIFDRPTKDLIPILPGRYQPHSVWQESLSAREEALRKRHMANHERWIEHTRSLPPLSVGHHVRIQNQVGSYPLRWDKTGVVIEVCQFHQYVVIVDGSGRITIRNRKFLCRYIPVHHPDRRRSILDDLKYLPAGNPLDQSPPTPIIPTDVPISSNDSPSSNLPEAPTSPSSTDQHSPPASPTLPHSPGLPQKSSVTHPATMSSPSAAPLRPPHIVQEQDSPSINLRHSTRIRKLPQWQLSGDYVFY